MYIPKPNPNAKLQRKITLKYFFGSYNISSDEAFEIVKHYLDEEGFDSSNVSKEIRYECINTHIQDIQDAYYEDAYSLYFKED